MQQLDFNTLDNQSTNGDLNRLTEQAQEAIKQMQKPVPPAFVPEHIVPPIIKKQMEREAAEKAALEEQQMQENTDTKEEDGNGE